MLRLNVRCRTEVYEIDSMLSKSKKNNGFLKPKNMPFSRKNRNPASLSVQSDGL